MKQKKRYVLFLVSLIAMLFCIGLAAAEQELLSVEEAHELVSQNSGNKNFIIIDLRTRDDYDQGHIGGAISMNYYATNFQRMASQLDRDALIFMYCQRGKQSPMALRDFKKMGFTQVRILDGGIAGWVAAGLPLAQP